MSLQAQLVTARETAGRAILAAKTLGQTIREKEEKHEAVTDLTPQFTQATKDAEQAIERMNRLEAEIKLENEQNRLTQATESFTGRVTRPQGTIETVRLNRQERREAMRLQRLKEDYARAGVTDMNAFKRFKEAHAEAFIGYLTEGNAGVLRVLEEHKFKPMEAMALLTTQGDLGGFLVPDEFRSEVLKDVAGMAVMRRICRVERTGKSALVFPSIQSASTDADIYSTGYTGAWQPEGYVTGGTAPTVQNQPKFGQTRIPVHVWAPNAVELTQELIGDAEADVDGIVQGCISETLSMDEDAAFINGNGVGKPLGLMTSLSGASITEVANEHASALTYEGIINMFSNLPAQYRQNARWLMNSLSLGAIMKLKTSEGMPLFPLNQVPGQLLGKPIEFSEFMPDIAADANPIVFGDFRHYGIADRQELRVQRLTERFAPNIGLLPTARVGGQTLRTAAFRKLKIATTV